MSTPHRHGGEREGPGDGPGADVSVRVGWAEDAPSIAAVQVRAWHAEDAGLLPPAVLAGLDPEEFALAWASPLERPRDARNRGRVALERSTVRGFAVTGPAADPDLDPIAVGEVSELTVDPDSVRHGHGSRLVQACADTLRADRFGTAVVWLNSQDDVRRAFLTGAGWDADGAHRELDPRGGGPVRVKQARRHAALSGPGRTLPPASTAPSGPRSSGTGSRWASRPA